MTPSSDTDTLTCDSFMPIGSCGLATEESVHTSSPYSWRFKEAIKIFAFLPGKAIMSSGNQSFRYCVFNNSSFKGSANCLPHLCKRCFANIREGNTKKRFKSPYITDME